MGECAGEVVSLAEFGLKDAERVLFEAQLRLDAGDYEKAGGDAFDAMVRAAQGLVKSEFPDVSANPDEVAREFRTRFVESKRFSDPFAGDKFAHYFFNAKDQPVRQWNAETSRQRIQEAQLFIEAAHNCNAQLTPAL